MENVTFENVQELLNGGKKPQEVFVYVGDFKNGFGLVVLNGKHNFINENCKILSPNLWFDGCWDFNDGFSLVKQNNKYNFIDENGRLLSNQWFDDYDGLFYEGFVCVKLNGKWIFVDRNGKHYDENRKPLKKNINKKEVNFENVQELLDSGKKPKEVFEYVADDFSDGFAHVELNNKWNFIDVNRKILSPNQWFDSIGCFQEGFAYVKLNWEFNFIDKNGKYLVPNLWFNNVGEFHEGFAAVELKGKWNYIDKNGNFLSPQWFDTYGNFKEGFAYVKFEEKLGFIDKNGNLYDENKVSLEQQKDKETTENKKRIYIVLSDKEYIDSFDNPYDAMVCVVQKQNTGEIEVVEKVF